MTTPRRRIPKRPLPHLPPPDETEPRVPDNDLAEELGTEFLEGATSGQDMSDVKMSHDDHDVLPDDEELPLVIDLKPPPPRTPKPRARRPRRSR